MNYKVDKKNKKIYVNIPALSAKDEPIIDRYLKYGYELVETKTAYKEEEEKARVKIPHIKKSQLKEWVKEESKDKEEKEAKEKVEKLLAEKKYSHAKAEKIWRDILYPNKEYRKNKK